LEMKVKKVKPKKYRTKYAGTRGKGVYVTLPFDPRKGVCEACGRSVHEGEIKSTALHHWWYAYKPATVAKNPLLALENTSELCYGCHQIADAIRLLLYSRPERVAKVARLLRGKQRLRFLQVLEAIMKEMLKNEKNIRERVYKIIRVKENAT